ncbi:MAG TPA: hypothetical protein VH143_19980 [Kofleriaceae bacterium]|jgi:hypothetical protein|nr:hypothetical protein [Kofleriaceae bacterium]
MRIAAAASVIALVSMFAAPVRAQNADAEAQFDDGRKLMKQGDFVAACKRFDASEKLEAAVGTELNLGKCYEELGRTASAWGAYKRALATAKRVHDHPRAAEAKQHVDALAPKLVHLEIDVADDRKVPGLEITRNGKLLDEALWNQSEPVDPDSYEIGAAADGYAPWTKTIDVAAKDEHVRVPMLDKQATARDGAAATTTAPPVTQRPPPTHVETHVRKAPIVLAIAGVVALGAGAGLGIASTSATNSANLVCPGPTCDDANAVSQSKQAHAEALVADLAFGVGGAALATAAIWWLVGGVTATERVSIVPTLGGTVGLAAVGRF